jgi:pimeloyl-ACP methyl ester carboxylesterase
VHSTGIAANVDCSERAVGRLVSAVRRIAEEQCEPVALVGHSRGGLFARAVAQRAPDSVSGVITLGAPHRDQLALHPLLWGQLMVLGLLGTLGAPGVLRPACATGSCCERFRDDLAAVWPSGVGLVSVYSRRDGVVDWRACLDRRGDNVEVNASHCGMILDPETYTIIRSALEEFRREWPPALGAAA